MTAQYVTYYLNDYKAVLDKSSAIEAVEGKVVIVQTHTKAFTDAELYKNALSKSAIRYTLVAKLPMSAAIKFC